ncbi:hypothetical protein HDR58_10510 [bacterium]|nr:hypothetical protein [bacterium]
MNMMKITNLKTYFTKPSKCFIPKCKSHCCINAPLPEDFLPKHTDKIQRQIWGGFNMGQNDLLDSYNSVIYSTRPVIFMGYDQNGNMLATINPKVMAELQLKNMDDVHNFIKDLDSRKILNYCPFIKSDASCSVYSERPPICREFGTAPGKKNECPDKSSRLEIIKFKLKDFYSFQKDVFKTMWSLVRGKNPIKFE